MRNLTMIVMNALFLIGMYSQSYAQPNNANRTDQDQDQTNSNQTQLPSDAPVIELVFCLDATGSMGGLIGTAKEKIWEIVTELSQSTPAPKVKIGMVFYRDKGEAFVTKRFELTEDLDGIYSNLLAIQAQGGGDSPESLNQALYEAVTKMGWSKNGSVYKTVFVVGDCPPHMDYSDDVKYMETCEIAQGKGIILNAIKLGAGCADAIPHFQAIARCSGGEYKQLSQHAQDVVVQTPFDNDINDVSRQIDQSKMYYGSVSEQSSMNTRKEKSLKFYSSASSTSNTQRAAYNSSSSGKSNWFGNKELIQDLIDGKVDVEKLKDNELPKELKGKSLAEKQKFIAAKRKVRKMNIAKLNELNKKRAAFVASEKSKAKNKGKESFSGELFRTMRAQAKSKGVAIGSH